MIDLSKGISFEQYLNKNTEEQKNKLLKVYKDTQLSETAKESVKNLKNEVNVVVFSEGYCPDCVVTIPFVERMRELNSNIKVFYYDRTSNKELMEQLTGTARIPTVITFSSTMEPKGAYVEVPDELAERLIKLSADKQKELIAEYRQGKYNNLIESKLLEIIK